MIRYQWEDADTAPAELDTANGDHGSGPSPYTPPSAPTTTPGTVPGPQLTAGPQLAEFTTDIFPWLVFGVVLIGIGLMERSG